VKSTQKFGTIHLININVTRTTFTAYLESKFFYINCWSKDKTSDTDREL